MDNSPRTRCALHQVAGELPTPRLTPLLPERKSCFSGERQREGGSEAGSLTLGRSSCSLCAPRLRYAVGRSVALRACGRAWKPAGAAFVGPGHPPPTPSRQKPLGADLGGSRSIGFAWTDRAGKRAGSTRRASCASLHLVDSGSRSTCKTVSGGPWWGGWGDPCRGRGPWGTMPQRTHRARALHSSHRTHRSDPETLER